MAVSRRKFITNLAVGAITLGGYKLASAKMLSDTLGNTTTAWEELSKAIGGTLYLPSDNDYGLKAMVNNLRYMAKLPAAIAIIDDSTKAQAAIQWCNKYRDKIKFRIKGGGHSYAGYSASADAPTLILYTQGMEELAYHPETRQIEVGSGVINYHLYEQFAKVQRTITHGRCPTVGVSGFVLGGGIGFDMRRYGVASDSLTQAKLVLASGDLVTASETENADLFWALRGGAGGNLGLSTNFTFATQDVSSDLLSVFHKKYATHSLKQMAVFLRHVMHSCQQMPRALGTRISVQYEKSPTGKDCDNQFTLDFIGQYSDQPMLLNSMLDDFERLLPADTVVENWDQYWVANHYLEEPDESFFYQERSTFIADTPPVNVIEDALERLMRRPDVHGPCDLRFFQTGGAINDVAKDATAFVHRNSQWIALVGYYWEKRDHLNSSLIHKGHEWQDDFYDFLLKDFQGVGAYQNFPDVSLKNWAEAYYGTNLPRLRAIKAKYDKDRIFDYEQAI